MERIQLNEYWPNFQTVAYAFYNNEEVHLFNHPTSNYKTITLHWEPVFNGADTLILYREYPTAIVNMEHYHIIESLYPILVHELFHGFQYLYGEKRFPDELMVDHKPTLRNGSTYLEGIGDIYGEIVNGNNPFILKL